VSSFSAEQMCAMEIGVKDYHKNVMQEGYLL
jgi:hypothetical protein